jgi:hypothetical protein
MHEDSGNELEWIVKLVVSGSVARIVVASSAGIVNLSGLFVPAQPFETHWGTHQIAREPLERVAVLGPDANGIVDRESLRRHDPVGLPAEGAHQ